MLIQAPLLTKLHNAEEQRHRAENNTPNQCRTQCFRPTQPKGRQSADGEDQKTDQTDDLDNLNITHATISNPSYPTIT